MSHACMSALLLAVAAASALVLALAPAAPAKDLSSLYGPGVLEKERPRLAGRFEELMTRAFRRNFTEEERARLSRIELRFPAMGPDRSPIEFYADAQAVYLPMLSLLFFEDLCTAYAWLSVNGYRLDVVDDYVAMLKYRGPEAFGGNRYPPPIRALRIPADALRNPKVDDLSLRFRNTGYAFILGHELGHIFSGHRGYGSDTPRQEARANEEAADRFALELMRRASTIPMGALLFFQTAVHADRNRWDFPSEQAWQRWLAQTATHPLSSRRLRVLAGELELSSESFARYESDRRAGMETLRFIASRIVEIAKILDDQDLYLAVRKRAEGLDASSLVPRR